MKVPKFVLDKVPQGSKILSSTLQIVKDQRCNDSKHPLSMFTIIESIALLAKPSRKQLIDFIKLIKICDIIIKI